MIKKKQKIFNICVSTSEGGLEFCVVKFAAQVRDEGHESIIICTPGSVIHKKAQLLELPILLIPKRKIPFYVFFQTIKYIRKHNPDVLITHRSPGLKRSAVMKIFFPKIKIISFLHTLLNFSKKDWLHRFLFSKVDEFIVFTEVQKQNICRFLPIKNSIVRVIPHTVDVKHYKPGPSHFKDELKIQPELPIIGCVGRFDLKKGQLELIDAADLMIKNGYKFQLIFIGQDTKSEEGVRALCESKVIELGLQSNVLFLDHRNDLTEAYRAFDIFVLPSHEETFELVLLEAMASGCLCVANYAGGPIEILDSGNAGVLVDSRAPASLSRALQIIMEDLESYAPFKTKARERVLNNYTEPISFV